MSGLVGKRAGDDVALGEGEGEEGQSSTFLASEQLQYKYRLM